MTKIKSITLIVLFSIILFSCERDNLDPYSRPEWLAGKLYTQILDNPELSTFAKAVELTGYDEIINVSGSYTVFAPSNDAFNKYFAENSKYNSVEDMPVNELSRIVKYHIVQNPWSKAQLRSLDVWGWIDTLDISNDEPRGFKRETLLLDENRKYGVEGDNREDLIIVDTTESNWTRRVATDSRKFAPIFFSEYFNIYDLNSYDYEFYFNRPFEGDTNIYFANAKITSSEIFAENGFVYIVDEVVEPLKNAAQILENEEDDYNYSDFLEIIHQFPEFQYDEEKTYDQPGAEQGLEVDSLFDLTYPELTFDISNEKTSAPSGTYGLPQNVTIRYHHGLMAPTNAALNSFENEYFAVPGGWGRILGAPDFIQRIIANTHMSINPIYPTDFENGFYNGELDIVTLDEGKIVQKEFSSNSTFLGLNEVVVPRAFSSITGPVYLRQGYLKVMYAIEQSGLLAALKRPNKNYSFYVESDVNTSRDSSLFYDPVRNNFWLFQITPGSGAAMRYSLSQSDLRTLLLNHVAVAEPKGIARKEFIPNLAGNFLIYNNETGEVSGTGKTTIGYNGVIPSPAIPKALSNNSDNGTTYQIDNWFSFASPSIYSLISTDYPKFHSLLKKAGLSRDKEFRYSFISDTEFYTIFIPDDAALDSANVNSMTNEELKNFLMMHFVQGDLIFTDGSKPSDYYQTLRESENSSEYTTVYTKMFIDTDYDVISIRANDGSNYVEINEGKVNDMGDIVTNMITGVNLSETGTVFPNIFNNGVVHEIDRVLRVEEIDTK